MHIGEGHARAVYQARGRSEAVWKHRQVFTESKGWRVDAFADVQYSTRATSHMKGVPGQAVKAVITKT